MKISFGKHGVWLYSISLASWFVIICLSLNKYLKPIPANSYQSTDPQLEAKVLQVIRNHPDVIFESVSAYQQKKQEQQQQAQRNFFQKMKANPKSVIHESPTTGHPAQKIVLVEFSDFQCPYCAKAYQTLKQFMASHQDQVTLVYKFMPSATHPEAMPAAKAAWAANQQGKFWEFHDALFENQDKLGESFYVATAKALNLDIKRFNQDRNSSAANAAIQKDVQLAQDIGVDGTPRLAMNGEPLNESVEPSKLEELLTRIGKR